MGSCLSYELPNDFIKKKLEHKIRCTMCMKPLKHSTIKCKNCNNSIGHLRCFRLWYSIENKCPICKFT